MSIRIQKLIFFRFAILALLAGFSSFSFAGWKASSSVHNGLCFNDLASACQSYFAAVDPDLIFTGTDEAHGYCLGSFHGSTGVQGQMSGCDSSCPAGEQRDPVTGACSAIPLNCTYPKTNVGGVCTCPSTLTTTVKTVLSPNDMWPGTVNVGGCNFKLSSSGNPDIDGKGNNCITNSDGSQTCFNKATSDGTQSAPCGAAGQPACPTNVTPVQTPTETKPAESSNTTKTDPATNQSTNTTSNTTTKVQPDGAVETKTTETTTQGSDTTVKTTTVTKNTSGTTTTTVVETKTGADGIPHTTISGTSTSNNPQTENSEDKEEGKGECEPTASNYFECLKILEHAPDENGQSLIDGTNGAVNAKNEEIQAGLLGAIQNRGEVSEPNQIVSWVKDLIPTPTSCANIGFTIKGKQFNITCSDTQPMREWFAWALALGTIWFCFQIAFAPRSA